MKPLLIGEECAIGRGEYSHYTFSIPFQIVLPFLALMTTLFALTSHCADSSLRRLDYAAVSQMALLELFIEGIDNKERIGGYVEYPDNISEWEGLTFNDTNEVTEIDWESHGFEGSLALKWLPFSVTELLLFQNTLSGSIDLASLPDKMEELDLSCNSFTGEIDLCFLPDSLIILDLSNNMLSGTVDLEDLPKSLMKLYLYQNAFTGNINLTSLPDDMEELSLSQNDFSGEIDFSSLSDKLARLNIAETNISGAIRANDKKQIITKDSKVSVIGEKH